MPPKALVVSAEMWLQEVRAMMPTPAPVHSGSGTGAGTGPGGSRANSRAAAAAAATSDPKKPIPASLRRVEQLLLEGERLPFELSKVLNSHRSSYLLFLKLENKRFM